MQSNTIALACLSRAVDHFARMQVNRIISRNRRVEGRATGHVFFLLRWPSGEFSQRCAYSTRLDPAIRLFTDRLRLVPPPDRKFASGHFDAEVRKARGGRKRLSLATWTAAQPLPEFFRAARVAWQRLPKEHDDQKRRIADEIDMV
jgi:hypothetical protein